MSPVQSIRIEVFQGVDGYNSLKPQWQQLATDHSSHFLHLPGWYEAELNVRADSTAVYFVGVFEADKLVAVLPMEHKVLRKKGIRLPIMQLFYDNEMGLDDVLSSISLLPHLQAITRALRVAAPFFFLMRWQCTGSQAHANSLLKSISNKRHTHDSKFISFSEGVEPFFNQYSSKFRKNIRKKMSKAQEQGELSLKCVFEQEELPTAFEHFLEVEGSGWKGQQGTSIAQQPAKLAYFHTLIKEFGGEGRCQINLLFLNEQVIAGHFSVIVDRTLFLLKIGYREEFAEVSPGYLILSQLIEKLAADTEIRKISFVTGVNWIDRWHPQADPIGIFYSSNGSVSGKLVLTALNLYSSYKSRQSEKKYSANEHSDDSH